MSANVIDVLLNHVPYCKIYAILCLYVFLIYILINKEYIFVINDEKTRF